MPLKVAATLGNGVVEDDIELLCLGTSKTELSEVVVFVDGVDCTMGRLFVVEDRVEETAGILSKKNCECWRLVNVRDDNVHEEGAWLGSERDEVANGRDKKREESQFKYAEYQGSHG